MGSSATPATAPSPEFIRAFQAAADGSGTLTFDRFMDLALYDPGVGYYRRAQTRVGYGRGTDFFTASTSGPLFGELVVAAVAQLLPGQALRDFTFVEIGAESAAGILTGVEHPFGAARVVRLGDPLELAGRCVVFSNELFDAQPVRRFVFRGNAWKERGVELRDGLLVEIELPLPEPPAVLPATAPEGYLLDAPFVSVALAEKLVAQPWQGLFLACDYGKSWRELTEATPAGTARAYYRHAQSNDLLARPGEQDLTCHACWDWLVEVLSKAGFNPPAVESQEAFFIHHAGAFIAALSRAEATRFSQKKLSLLQLLHPSHLGQKFQVLHAQRL